MWPLRRPRLVLALAACGSAADGAPPTAAAARYPRNTLDIMRRSAFYRVGIDRAARRATAGRAA